MKNSKLICVITTVFIFLFTSCYKHDEFHDNSCKDVKIGEVELSDKAKNFAPLKDWKSYTFIDHNGNELNMEHTATIENGERINVNYLCSQDSYFETTVNNYEYYQTFEKVNVMVSPDEEYIIRIRTLTVNEEESINEPNERVFFSLGSRVVGLYNISAGAFEEYLDNKMEKLETVEINGKTFENVLRVSHQDYDGVLYLKEGVGVVGFVSKGKRFVLK